MQSDQESWASRLQRHAESRGDGVALRFLPQGEAESASTWTFADVERESRAVAALLSSRVRRGDRVLLLHPPGLAFVAAFLGCVRAGVIAVPSFPPRGNAASRRDERLAGILRDAQPSIALTTADTLAACRSAMDGAAVDVLVTDTLTPGTGDGWHDPDVGAGELACLQYTSGTTGTPRGVMLTHGALLANCAQIAERFEHDAASRGVIWLPPYHDMGLVGGILQPLFVGFEVTLMPAAAFLQKPMRWLRAISRFGGTTSGGPTFAFDACLNAAGNDGELAGLDLSTWRVAFVGAEPVRAKTLARFAERFAPCGFDPQAFLPCYGLAEATLIVSGRRRGSGVHTTPSASGASDHVDCGPPARGVTIEARDPVTGESLAPGIVGELCVRSPALASGYWRDEAATRSAFGVPAPTAGASWLRTGDLGFVAGESTVIVGRAKDLLIVRGVNHAPETLEATATESHPALQPHGAAAFPVEDDTGERAVLVHELRREQRNAEPAAIVRAIRGAIAEAHGVELSAVLLVRPGAIPRTPSGKVRRHACRVAFAADAFEPIHGWREGDVCGNPTPSVATPAAATFEVQLAGWIATHVAPVVNEPADQISLDEPLVRYGIGSADAVGLAGKLSELLGVDLPAMALWDHPSLCELARHLIDEHQVDALPASTVGADA